MKVAIEIANPWAKRLPDGF
jgi:hypothetical protein